MARFSLYDFKSNQRLLKTSIERVERLSELRKKLVAISDDLGDYYTTEFVAGYSEGEVGYSVQDALENLIACIDSDICKAKADADFASTQFAHAIFGGESDD